MASTVRVYFEGHPEDLNRAFDSVQAKAAETSSRLSKIRGGLQSWGASLRSWGTRLSAAVTLPLVGAGVAAWKMAADMIESVDKLKEVFGNNWREVNRWSKNTSASFGVARFDALSMVSTFGAMFSAMDLSGTRTVTMSERLTKLAGDMASLHNEDPTDVFMSIKSAIAGEFEPMKKYGTLLNTEKIELQAIKMGLIEEGDALDDASRARAVYALLLEKNKTSLDNWKKTQGSAANQTKGLKNQLKDLAVVVGKKLMPIGLTLLGWIQNVLNWFEKLSPKMQNVILITLGIAAAIGPVLLALGFLASAIAALMTTAGAVIGVVGALVVGLGALAFVAFQNRKVFSKGLNGKKVKGELSGVEKVAYETGKTWRSVTKMVGRGWNAKPLKKDAGIIETALWALGRVFKGLRKAWDHTVAWFRRTGAAFARFWKRNGDTIKKYARDTWKDITGIFRSAVRFISSIIEAFSAAFRGDWGAMWKALKKAAGAAFDILKRVFSTAWRTIKSTVHVAMREMRLDVRDIMKRTSETVIDWIDRIVNFFKNLPTRIARAARNLGSTIRSKIADVIKGIKIKLPFGFQIGGDGLGIGGIAGTQGGPLLGISPLSAVGRAYSMLGRPGDVISGFRPGSRTRSGALSYHARGRALDLTPIRAIAMLIHRFFKSRTLELITPWRELDLWHGRPHWYSPGIHGDHSGGNAHIHWAMAMGAYLRKPFTGLVKMAERNPEIVSPVPIMEDSFARVLRRERGQGMTRADLDYLVDRLAQVLGGHRIEQHNTFTERVSPRELAKALAWELAA